MEYSDRSDRSGYQYAPRDVSGDAYALSIVDFSVVQLTGVYIAKIT